MLNLAIGGVWIFHGLYSKVLNGIPRHQRIVARVLGQAHAGVATRLIGAGEVLLGVWAVSDEQPLACAAVQTLALVAMNILEIRFAQDLLISPIGMVLLNGSF